MVKYLQRLWLLAFPALWYTRHFQLLFSCLIL